MDLWCAMPQPTPCMNMDRNHLTIIQEWLSQFANLYCIGRYGQFRYNNMDHSMMTGILAARRMLGEDADPWSVNAEGEYLEEKAAKLR